MISTVVLFQHAGNTSAASCKLEALQSHLKRHPLNSLAIFLELLLVENIQRFILVSVMCVSVQELDTRVQEGTFGVQKRCQNSWHCSWR